jgi:hypothetical protein
VGDLPQTKVSFTKKEKTAEELHLQFFYPDGFTKTDSRPCIVFFCGSGITMGYRQFYPQAQEA